MIFLAGTDSNLDAMVKCVSEPIVPAHMVNGIGAGVGDKKWADFIVCSGESDPSNEEYTTSTCCINISRI